MGCPRLSEEPSDHGVDFGGSDVIEGVDAVGGEDLDGRDAADVAPVGPVVGGADDGVVVCEVFSGGEVDAVGEGDVVLGEAFLSEGKGGDDEDGAGAEAEEEDAVGAVTGREAAECLVERLLEVVEVANDWKRGRAWWVVFLFVLVVEGEEKLCEEEERDEREGNVRDGRIHLFSFFPSLFCVWCGINKD